MPVHHYLNSTDSSVFVFADSPFTGKVVLPGEDPVDVTIVPGMPPYVLVTGASITVDTGDDVTYNGTITTLQCTRVLHQLGTPPRVQEGNYAE